MKFALIGKSGVGKSILFDLLRGERNFHSLQHSGRLTTVNLPDERLQTLIEVLTPKRYKPVELILIDPGLGYNLSSPNLQDSDTLCLMVKENLDEFEEVIKNIFKRDIEIAEKRLESLKNELKKRGQDEILGKEHQLLQKIPTILKDKKFINQISFNSEELKFIAGYQFLSSKKIVLLLNSEQKTPPVFLSDKISELKLKYFIINVNLHYEIAQLKPGEREVYYREYGLEENELENLLKFIYFACDFILFYTIVGEEIRAWPLSKGGTVLEAASKIHTDMARGFIRAEVIPYDDFCKSEFSLPEAKEKGFLRLEGKEYIVNDGDIIYIRFKV